MNELKIGEYLIPEGCTFKRVGNTIQVYRKKKDKLKVDEYRCKDCKHYVEGHTGSHFWTTAVCDMKPKKRKCANGHKLFYMAQKYGKPCELFELRKEKQDERGL